MKRLLLAFFTSLGVILGGALIGSIGATLARKAPLKAMNELAREMKLWAVATAIGGTFSNLKALEGGVFQGRFLIIIKQFLIIIAAFLGAQLGIWLISVLTGGS